MPAFAAQKGRLVAEDHTASIRRAIAAGVKVAFGTDAGVGPHGTNGEEFLLLNQLGMRPADCIRSATSVAAGVLDLAGRAGTLSEGAFGDLIGVPGDPCDNLGLIARPENIHLVVKGGEVVKEAR